MANVRLVPVADMGTQRLVRLSAGRLESVIGTPSDGYVDTGAGEADPPGPAGLEPSG